MNADYVELIRKAEGRYLHDQEAARLRGYAEGLLARLDTLTAIERAEEAMIDAVVDKVMKMHPQLPKAHGADVDRRVRRDQTQVLRYAAFAMLMRDPDFIYDKLSMWLRTVLVSLCDLAQVIAGYEALIEAAREHLTEEDAKELIPYIEIHLEEFRRAHAQTQAA